MDVEAISREEERAEVLRAWPDAAWMPWDTPPIGQRVFLSHDASGRRRTGIVVGRADLEPIRQQHCPTCSCAPVPRGPDGWWIVRLDVPFPIRMSPSAAVDWSSIGPESFAIDVLEYPPSLEPW